jgi:hypothetical protein
MQAIGNNYTLLASNKQIFNACNQSAQAVSVALNTTYTGLCLSNPNNSNRNLYLLRVGAALSVAPAAIAPIGIIGAISTTDVTHTAAGTVASTFVGSGSSIGTQLNQGVPSVGLVDTQATLPVAPTWLEMLMGGFTAAALPASPLANFDFQGSWVIPPGGYICVGSLTAVTGFFSMTWAALPQ